MRKEGQHGTWGAVDTMIRFKFYYEWGIRGIERDVGWMEKGRVEDRQGRPCLRE